MNIIISVLFYVCNIADLYFTLRLVKKYGVSVEANPVGKFLLRNKWLLYALKVAVGGAVAVALAVYDSALLTVCRWMLFVIYAALFGWHIFIIRHEK